MDFVRSMVMDTAAIPVAVSVILAFVCTQFPKVADLGGILAVSAAFFCGWASQSWTTLNPERYLDWLPYAGVGVCLFAVPVCRRLPPKYSWPLMLLGCLAVAWFLVPEFPKLQPTRPVAIAIITFVGAGVALLLAHFEVRLPRRLLPATLMGIGTMAALVLAQSFGLKFAQIAGMLTASLAGPFLFPGSRERPFTGVALVFIPLLCNLMFMGYASSSSAVPAYSFALIPIAAMPLLLLAVEKQHRPKKRFAAVVVGVAVLIGIAVVPALLAHPPWQEDY